MYLACASTQFFQAFCFCFSPAFMIWNTKVGSTDLPLSPHGVCLHCTQQNSACSDRHYHHFFRLYGSRSLLYTAVVCSAPSFFFCRGAYEYIRLSRDNALPLHLREANHIHPVCVIYCFPDTISTKNLFGPAHWLPFIDRFWSCNKSMKPIDKTLLIC